MKVGQVEKMFDKIEDGELLVGPMCRGCDASGYHLKTEKPDTVLTSTMMMPKRVLIEYQLKFPYDYDKMLTETRGNGEDISMNHFVRKKYGKNPFCIKLDVKTLDTSSGYSSKSGHYEKRSEICKTLFIL